VMMMIGKIRKEGRNKKRMNERNQETRKEE
jgi:hypothetical protein